MAVGGNVEVRSLTDFQAVNNLYVSGTILTSGSIQLGFSLVDGDSDLILSSSATSRVVVSGTLNVTDQLLVQGQPVGAVAVTGSRDFFVQNILDVSGSIRNPVSHVILSSSAGSQVTVSGTLHATQHLQVESGGRVKLGTSGNRAAIRGSSIAEATLETVDGTQLAFLRLAGINVNGSVGLFGNGNDFRIGDGTNNDGTYITVNGLSGKIVAPTKHLILSSSVSGSYVKVSGNLDVLGVITQNGQPLGGAASVLSSSNNSVIASSGSIDITETGKPYHIRHTSERLILSASGGGSRVFVSGVLAVPYNTAEPTVRLGDDGVGMSAENQNLINFWIQGIKFAKITNDVMGAAGSGPQLILGFTPSPTVASIIPTSGDTNTGIGWNGNDIMAFKAGGKDMITISSGSEMLVVFSGSVTSPNDAGNDRAPFSEQFGYLARAASGSTTALGHLATALFLSGTAIGARTIVSGAGGVAVGFSASIVGTDGISIGRLAKASSGISIGRSAGSTSNNNVGIIIGANSSNNDATSLIIIGAGTSAQGQSIMIGHGSQATATNSIVIGNSTFNSRNTNIVIGNGMGSGDLAGAGTAVAIGDDAKANTNTISMGASAGGANGTEMGIGSISIGHTARSHGQAAIAIGQNASAQETGSLAFGLFASASFRNSIAFGSASFAHTASMAVFGTASSPMSVFVWGRVTGQGLALSSSDISHTASVHKWFVGGNQVAEFSNNNGIVLQNLGVFIGDRLENANGATPLKVGSANTSHGLASSTDLLVAGSTEINGTLWADNGIRLTGSVTGDHGHLILSNSAGSTVYASGTMKARAGIGAGYEDYVHSSGSSNFTRWYWASTGEVATSVTNPQRDVVQIYPFIAPRRRATLKSMGIFVTSGQANTKIRVGLYDTVSESNIYPNRIIHSGSELDTTTGGIKTFDVNLELEPGGLYWAAIHVSGAGVNPSIKGFTAAVGSMYPVLGTPDLNSDSSYSFYLSASADGAIYDVTGSFPDPFPSNISPVLFAGMAGIGLLYS